MTEPEARQLTTASFGILVVLTAAIVALIFIWQKQAEATPLDQTPQTFEHGTVSWHINPEPAKALQLNSFTLDIRSEDGQPLTGAAAIIKLDMISMDCADVDIKLTESSNGIYTGEGMPLMAGAWNAELTLATSSGTYTISKLVKVKH